MPQYQVIYTGYFRKDFDKLDAITQRRVLFKLEKLQNNPYAGEKLKAKEIGI